LDTCIEAGWKEHRRRYHCIHNVKRYTVEVIKKASNTPSNATQPQTMQRTREGKTRHPINKPTS
jgi:hypothetical protein